MLRHWPSSRKGEAHRVAGHRGVHPFVEGSLVFPRTTTDRVARPSRQGGRVAKRQEAAPCGFQSRSMLAIPAIGPAHGNSNRFALWHSLVPKLFLGTHPIEALLRVDPAPATRLERSPHNKYPRGFLPIRETELRTRRSQAELGNKVSWQRGNLSGFACTPLRVS